MLEKIAARQRVFIHFVLGVAATLLFAGCFTAGPGGTATARPAREPAVKNLIVFVADGRGFNQMEATSIYRFGWREGQIYQNFPVRLATATYPHGGGYDPSAAWEDFGYFKNDPTDSAASATAMSTGHKTHNGRIGVGPEGESLEHLAKRLQEQGKSAGVVTSVQFSHATPASFVTHHESRNEYEEIARQMIEESDFDVIMGAGHPLYDNNAREKEEYDYKFVGDEALWERIVAGEAGGDRPWTLIESREEFRGLMGGDVPERVLGIPQVRETLQFYRDGNGDADPFEVPLTEEVPTLEEMALGALNVLSRNDRGFFLQVEGGAVDWASHRNNSPRMIEEHAGFDDTVEAIVEWVEANSSWEETLVVVTGDHETGYLTGPGSGPDSDPIWRPIENRGQGVLPGMEWHSGGHTNQLIPFFARGAGAERFRDYIIGIDPERGPYVHLTSIAEVGFSLFEEASP